MELIHSENQRIEQMKEYLAILCSGTTKKDDYLRYESVLGTATPFEANSALDALLGKTNDVQPLMIPVARFIRALGKGLESQSLPEYPKGSIFASLVAENEEIRRFSQGLQQLAKTGDQSKIQTALGASSLVRDHYQRLQNELFPQFEQMNTEHACVKLMWAIQDDALLYRKKCLEWEGEDTAAFLSSFSRFYSAMEILRYRETYILYPVVFRSMAPVRRKEIMDEGLLSAFQCLTGSLSQEELERIFSLLPIDIAFIGADDRVKFYSNPPHRIFPRSVQVIGRLVQNCHPPKSVATVEAILTSFKEGRDDRVEFYLTMQEKFIHIQYLAVRSTDGTYLGTLEVSQDATHLRSLKGEKRLL